jgi:HSP20 family protein
MATGVGRAETEEDTMNQPAYPAPADLRPDAVSDDVDALRAQVAEAGEGPVGYGGVSVEADDAGWTIVVQLPGVAAEELRLGVESQELRIDTVTESDHSDGFHYRLALPAPVRTDAVDATMDHGLLTVRLHRADGGRAASTAAVGDQHAVGTVGVDELPAEPPLADRGGEPV